MKFKKARKIFRILFPKHLSEKEKFEITLTHNHLIERFELHDTIYKLCLLDATELFIRNYRHSDYSVFNQIFISKEYELISKLFQLNVEFPNELVIIDAGANVGFTAFYFKQCFNNSRIFCVEPSSNNIELLQKNLGSYITDNSIKVYNNALCEKMDMSFTLGNDYRDKKDWSITTNLDENGEIKGITLNEIIFDNNLIKISLLKIDIEGAERFIFKKGNDLSFLEITEIIALEIHDEFNIRSTINELLKEFNFLLIESGELTIGINKKLLN